MAATEQRNGGGGGGSVRCYYELLEVERQVTDEELKKAYRRLALRWHPDKNPHRVEEATAQFRLVQKAYETLCDPQERAWYDKHRERILKGGLGRGDSYREERLDVFQYFTSACYDDYDDGPEGYFTVYAKVFRDLAEEETRACDGDDSPPPVFPEFGRSDSDYEATVGQFYAHWETFFTRKSYVWVEQHDTREADNKFVRKAMEKENRAAREAARRERNEEVRTLVAFVKKRDPRVRAERKRLEARAREVEAKARAKAAAARRAHLATASSYQAPEWARMGDLEAELARLETAHGAGASDVSDSSDEDSDDKVDAAAATEEGVVNADAEADDGDPLSGLLVCRACEKLFRTQGAKLSHDRSKRHRDRLERLRAEFAQHDEAVAETGAVPEAETVAAAEVANGGDASNSDDVDEDDDDDDDEDERAAAPAATAADKKKKRKNKKNKTAAVALGLLEDPAAEKTAVDASDAADSADAADTKKQPPRRRKDRQRQKQQELLEQRQEAAGGEAGGATQVCKACRQWFDSKNLLFKHLKESGHAATKPGAAAAAAAKAKADAAATAAASRTEGKKSSGKRK